MNHLGALITPYVDGELSPTRAAEARAHLVGCEQCVRAVQAERTARRRMQSAAAGVQASPELTARLLAMPPAAGGTAQGLDQPRSRLMPFVLGGGTALVGLFVLTLFVLGSPRPAETPSSLLASLPTTPGTVSASPATFSTAELTSVGARWVMPSGLQVGSVDVLEDGEIQTLDMTISGPDGVARVLERGGTLDDEAVSAAGLVPISIAGHHVYEVDGWFVLESGDCVVAIVGENEAAVEAVIAELPAPLERGVLDRIGAGWSALVG